LEETGISIWLRGSGFAFFPTLTLLSLAMAFVVGINIVIGLRLAGFAAAIPLAPLRKFYPLHWACVGIIVISGIGLLTAYPAKALTNPVFYLKLSALGVALLISRYFQNYLRSPPQNSTTNSRIVKLAYLTLLLWVITLTACRFLAYTHNILLASHGY